MACTPSAQFWLLETNQHVAEGHGARRSHDEAHALPVRDLVGLVAGLERLQGRVGQRRLLAGLGRDCSRSGLDDFGGFLWQYRGSFGPLQTLSKSVDGIGSEAFEAPRRYRQKYRLSSFSPDDRG